MKNLKIQIVLIFLSILFLVIYYSNFGNSKNMYDNVYSKMKNISSELYNEKIRLNLQTMSTEDKLNTGLIGVENSEITTTIGDLEAKKISTNFNFAGLILSKLEQIGVTANDYVLVNMSGSFPALNIATIVALDELKARGIIINSVGSSTFGANIADFTYLDMEKFLLQKKLIKNHTIAYSMGGDFDIGYQFDNNIIKNIRDRIEKNFDIIYISEPDLNKNIIQKIEIYNNYLEKSNKPKAFINIGGNFAASGDEVITDNEHIIINPKTNMIKKGLIGHYLQEKIPVLCLLNIKKIAAKHGLIIGNNDKIYFNTNNIIKYIVIIILFCIFLVSFLLKNKINKK